MALAINNKWKINTSQKNIEDWDSMLGQIKIKIFSKRLFAEEDYIIIYFETSKAYLTALLTLNLIIQIKEGRSAFLN